MSHPRWWRTRASAGPSGRLRLRGPGLSAYALADGVVYRTYVTTARGLEAAMAYYGLLDRTPKGRDEDAQRPLWVRRHDEYERRGRPAGEA